MKITLLEPLGIPEEVLARYQSRLVNDGTPVHRLWIEYH